MATSGNLPSGTQLHRAVHHLLQWDVLDDAADGSAADTDFELLDSDTAESSDDGDGPEDPDMALRQQQHKQRAAYKPPEPTQVAKKLTV